MRTVILKWLPGIAFLSLLIGCSSPTEETAGDDPKFIAADGYNGGKLYDMFWNEETGFDQGNPQISIFNNNRNFFRCLICHGYDLLGRQGGFAKFDPSDSTPNAANINLYAIAKASKSTDLFKAIKTGSNPAKRRGVDVDLSAYDPLTNNTVGDRMPNYGAILSDAQIWDLVKFLKAEAIDVKQLYDFTVSGSYPNATVTFYNIGKDGNAAEGDSIYTQSCGTCHGDNGMEFTMSSIGMHLRTVPYMDAFIFKFGILGMMDQTVLNTKQMKNLFKALTDEGKYPSP